MPRTAALDGLSFLTVPINPKPVQVVLTGLASPSWSVVPHSVDVLLRTPGQQVPYALSCGPGLAATLGPGLATWANGCPDKVR